MKSTEQQLTEMRGRIMAEARDVLLREYEDRENEAVLHERVPDICQQASEAREMALQRWEAHNGQVPTP